MKNRHRLTLRCASHLGVKLRGVHHTSESSDQNFSKSSMVCITQQSQTVHDGVKIKIFFCLTLRLTIRRNLFWCCSAIDEKDSY